MRLIDADRLCEDLLNRWNIADIKKEELIRQVMADIVTPIVVSQPTIEPQEWIPCSERSPQKSGNYIVTERRYSMDDRKHEGKYQTIVEEVRFTGEKWDRAKFFDIIAWMPLPKPYEENKL